MAAEEQKKRSAKDRLRQKSSSRNVSSNTYATDQEQETMEISIKKLIAKYKKCINHMNRVLTDEPPGSDALAKEFTAIDPNTNTLENKLTDIQIEASHSKYNNQHQAALLILEGLQTEAAEVYENCRKTVRAIQAATGPSAYSRVRWQTKFQPLQLSRLNPGGTLYEFIHQVQEIQKQQPIYKTELQGTLKDWILDTIRTEDPTTAQEVRLQCPREEVKPVINYLAEHFGTASQIEALAIAHHNKTGQLVRPYHKDNAAANYQAANAHHQGWHSIQIMVNYNLILKWLYF